MTMNDPEDFLTRWSRRKRGLTNEKDVEHVADDSAASIGSTSSRELKEGEPPFDLASLPPIESIRAETDIRAFLTPGVPTDLARAALRRAWSSDFTIRDFIGLSENSWDFNAPGAMPGFGPIDKKEVGHLLRRVLGEPDAAAVAARPATALSHADTAEKRASESRTVEEVHTVPEPATLVPAQNERTQVNIANANYAASPRRRGHGSALPQ